MFVLLLLTPELHGVDHEVVYAEGYPYIRDREGEERDIGEGDIVQTGDTVVTGSGDYVEFEANGYTVKIYEDTVFSIMEREDEGQKSDVLSCILGKLVFSKDRFFGNEPILQTSSAVLGVRGTSVVLLAGVDGTSLIVVETGRLEVEAGGDTIGLGVDEGVEVETGSVPGKKFQALARELDYSKWNRGRLDALLDDPVGTALRVETQMQGYIAEIKRIHPLYLETKDALDSERATVDDILEKKGKQQASVYYRKNVFPLEQSLTFRAVNLRYYALSAFSLRRFIQSRLYLTLKALYITRRDDLVYRGFLEVHGRILDIYEVEVVKPFLVLADF